MAILTQPTSNSNPFADRMGDNLAPAGTYVATLIDIKDEFGVPNPYYGQADRVGKVDNKETKDVTTFLFGFRDQANSPHMVTSKRMTISGSERATLFQFLKSMMGHAPQYGWDYCELKGSKVLLTVEHVTRRDGNGVFPSIVSATPVPAGMVGGQVDGPVAPAPTVAPAAPATPPPAAPSVAPAQPATPVAPPAGSDPLPF